MKHPPEIGLADLHMHTTFSDGRDTPADVIDHCRRRQTPAVIAVTDHDTLEGALRAADHAARFSDAPAVVVGEEVSSADGHILGLFLDRPVARGLSARATVEAIHEQNGLAIAAHPFWHAGGSCPHGVGHLIGALPFDAVEVLNAGLTPDMVMANLRAVAANRTLGLAAVGASDAHVREAVGCGHTIFQGRTAAQLRSAITSRSTIPGRTAISLRGVGRYLAWGLGLGSRRPLGSVVT